MRVEFSDAVRAGVSSPNGSQRREGHLFDISGQGCAILFENEESWMLDHTSPLLVHLELFPGEPLLVCRASVRSRRVSGLTVVHGFRLELDHDDPRLTLREELEDQVERFLVLRSREIEMRQE